MFARGLNIICLVQSKMPVRHEKNPWPGFVFRIDKTSTSIWPGVMDQRKMNQDNYRISIRRNVFRTRRSISLFPNFTRHHLITHTYTMLKYTYLYFCFTFHACIFCCSLPCFSLSGEYLLNNKNASITPNANMADLSVGPGLVARKRG